MTRNFRREWVWVLLLTAAGLAVRLVLAWLLQWSRNPDASICLLMTKHMVEGRDWPVFFYGQAYMGNVEPLVSAWVCKVVGWSTYRAMWGTVLIGLAVVPVAFAWARKIGGFRAGVTAALLCVVGPFGFAHYSVSPRGGYALQIAFTPAILLWVGCIARREWEHRPPAWLHYVGVGILAGLAWWTSQLILACLLASGLVFLPALLRRGAWRRGLLVVAAFGLGSAPWWYWNAHHQWGTFGFAESLDQSTWSESMRNLVLQLLPGLLDAPVGPSVLTALVLAAFALGMVWVVVRTFRRGDGEPPDAAPSPFLLVPLWLYPLLHLAISAFSSFASGRSPRYMLPLFPELAVAVGIGLAALGRRRVGRVVAPVVVVLLIIAQVHAALVVVPPMVGNTRERFESVRREVVPALREAGVEALYASYFDCWLNVASDEACAWSDPVSERYLPYMLSAEMTDRLGVWGAARPVYAFIVDSGGAARTVYAAGMTFWCDLEPPPRNVAEIPSSSWAGAHVAGSAKDMARTLSDRSLSTACEPPRDTNEPYVVTVDLAETTTVCGVRWINGSAGYPTWWRVETLGADGAWAAVTTNVECQGFYWNGPRLYWGWSGFQGRAQFPAVRTRGVRLAMGPAMKRVFGGPHVAEVSLLTPEPAGEDEPRALSNLLAYVREDHIRRLYCGRWLANKVADATGGRVWTPRERRIWERRSIQDVPLPYDALRETLEVDAGTAFAVTAEDAPALQEVVAACGIPLEQTQVGPWTVFRVGPGLTESGRFLAKSDLAWWGTTALADAGHADLLAKDLPDSFPESDWDWSRMESWLEAKLKRYPDHPAILTSLSHLARSRGDDAQAAAFEKQLHEQTAPDIPVSVRFQDGWELAGLSCLACRGAPGGALRIRLFWKVPRDVEPRPTLFLHARFEGRRTFQNDVAVMEGRSPAYLASFGKWPSYQDVILRIPPDAPRGRYELQLGVVSSEHGRRLKAATDLPHHHGAVTLPVDLVVE